jgi:hypothetical protein
MSKLWIFGDSYGVPYNKNKEVIDWGWTYKLGKSLGVNQYCNCSEIGASNEYTVNRILKYKNEIAKDDFVVVISTSITRKWFIPDKPWVSNYQTGKLSNHLSSVQIDAILNYTEYLHNQKADIMYFHQFLGWVHYMTDLHHWNVIVIPGFEEEGYPISHKYQVSGSLFDVCMNEFESSRESEWFYSTHYADGFDSRLGHLIKDNHEILSTRLYNTFVSKMPLDLRKGFIEKIISKKNINQIEDQFINKKPS